ncbi:MAG TPA: NUDIX domain-containing protein [Thermoanaerobaculia bacterium]|nr:NUDIX domain-containing protein [Thermoanaerobaculia bacterium]
MNRRDELLEMLRGCAPADDREHAHRDAVERLLVSSADPFSRSQYDPGHVTASCFVIDSAGRLLLHHHRRLGRWLQMGGHLEADESPAGAALREAEEESGLHDLELLGGVFDVDVHSIPAGKGEPDHAHFDVRFLGRTGRPGGIVANRTESRELAWFHLRDAVRLMNEEASFRVVRKIQRYLEGVGSV